MEQQGRDNARSHSTHSSRREGSTSRSASGTWATTRDEQPRRRIDRKRAFGQSTSVSEVKDAHQGSALKEKVQGTRTEQTQEEEVQDEEDDIDQDYDLTKSPFDPMGNYLGSEHETMPAIKSQPMLHDPLPRYVTETKYLIDLVPTKEGVTSEKLAMEASPEQSLSSSTASSSETEDEDDDTVQEQADEEYLEQMEIDYKGTEGTWEDIGGVSETYHPIPCLEED